MKIFNESLQEMIEKVADLPRDHSIEDWLNITLQFAIKNIARDHILRDMNDLHGELAIFDAMSQMDFPTDNRYQRDVVFNLWLLETPNPFAKVYKLGSVHRNRLNGLFNSGRAANGRRLIGATTRNRVRAEAAKRMHLTKGAAAYEIGSAINLSPDRVRKLLSELFPGDSWVTSPDLTSRNTQSS